MKYWQTTIYLLIIAIVSVGIATYLYITAGSDFVG